VTDAARDRSETDTRLSPLVRFLLWDYERGSAPYDIAFVLVALVLLVADGSIWGDPLWSGF